MPRAALIVMLTSVLGVPPAESIGGRTPVELEILWEARTEWSSVQQPAVDGDRMFVLSEHAIISTWDIGRGARLNEPVFHLEGKFPGTVEGMLVRDGRLYITASDNFACALDVTDLTLDWYRFVGDVNPELWPSLSEQPDTTSHDDVRVNIRSQFQVSSPVMNDSVLFFGSQDGSLYALSSETGEQLWRSRIAKHVSTSARPVLFETFLLAVTTDRRLVAVDQTTGQFAWSIPIEQHAHAVPALRGSQLFLAGGGTVIAVDLAERHVVWRAEVGHQLVGSLDLAEDFLVAADMWGTYCLDSSSGDLRWSYDAPAYHPLIDDGRVLLAAMDGRFLCLDLKSGRTLATLGIVQGISAAPILKVEDRFVFGVPDRGTLTRERSARGGQLYCIRVLE
jgi:outer membrane protein assembly factor BamB